MDKVGAAKPVVEAPLGYRCLVIGPIGDALAPVGSPENESYVRGIQVLGTLIEPACKRFGITPIRADGMRRRGDIPSQVYVAIRDWDLVIADLTGGNPNVMYELALRHLTGKCSISIAEWGRLPFDVSHIRTDKYVHTEVGLIGGRVLLEASIESVLTESCDDLPVTLVFRRAEWPPAETDATDSEKLVVGAATVAAETTAPEAGHAVPEPSENGLGATPSAETAVGEAPEELDLGFLDLLVETEDAFPLIVQHLHAATQTIAEIGAAFERATTELGSATTSRDRLIIAVRVGQHLEGAADLLEKTVDSYAYDMARVDRGMAYILGRLEADADERAQSAEFTESLRALRDSKRTSMSSTSGLISSVEALARIAKTLRGPSSRVALALRRFADTSDLIESWGRRIDLLPPASDTN